MRLGGGSSSTPSPKPKSSSGGSAPEARAFGISPVLRALDVVVLLGAPARETTTRDPLGLRIVRERGVEVGAVVVVLGHGYVRW